MIVLILSSCPPALRGDLTKWLQEVNTGVYVGNVSSRVRDNLWERVVEHAKSGRATLIFSTNNEQRMDFRVHNTIWEPMDFDGLKLMLRPSPARLQNLSESRLGYSNAARRRKGKRISESKRKKDLYPPKYAVVDLETTGISVTKDEIIEIGAVIIENKKMISEFSALLKSKMSIPSSVQCLTGITNEMLESEGRDPSDVLSEFLDFIEDLPIVCHNVNFDLGFLRLTCQNLGLSLLSNRTIDTLSLARRILRDINNFKLETLLDYFKIPSDGMHRSLSDCIHTFQVYEKLIEIQQEAK